MTAGTRHRLRAIVIGALIASALGAGYGWVNTGRLLEGSVVGLLIALTMGSFELLVFESPRAARLRRWALAPKLALRVLIYGCVSLGVLVLVDRLIGGAVLLGNPRALARALAFSFLLSAAFNILLDIRSLLGAGTLAALISGRYHRPRVETRAILMIDLKESTTIAERMGPEGFFELLNQFVFAASNPILDSGGEIYRYVGDEIIVTWPASRAGQAAECLFKVEAALDGVPQLAGCRAALHAGPVVVGELGDVKREIAVLGDTMNAAARLQRLCRELGRDRLASVAALELAALPPGIRAEPLGGRALRGREIAIEVFALERESR
jgi:adenylate cyclase